MYFAPRERISELPMLAVSGVTETCYAERGDVRPKPSRLDHRTMVGSHDRRTVSFARPTLRGFRGVPDLPKFGGTVLKKLQ